MRAVLLHLGEDDPTPYAGAVVAAHVPGVGTLAGPLRKGHVLDAEDLVELAALARLRPDLRVPLLLPDPHEMLEDEAATRLGVLLAGPGIILRGPAQGKTQLVAVTRGLLRVDAARLGMLNTVPDLAIYTLFDNQPVDAGTVVAEAKCTPLLIAAARLTEAEQIAHAPGSEYRAVVDLLPFPLAHVGLLIRERLDDGVRARTWAVLARKLAWFGATLLADDPADLAVPDEERAVAARLQALLAQGADLILTAGGSLSDPFDATLGALGQLGAELVVRGLPVHPGSLLWVAYAGTVPILGVPSCGLLSASTSFDIVLPRLLARGRAALADLPALGIGGLLTRGMEHRYPPYGEGAG